MSTLSEQIKSMRDCVKKWQTFENMPSSEPFKLLSESADTIEALSAKLAAANMDRSDRYYSGGWIACEDRLPEEGKEVLVYLKQGRMTVAARIGKEWVRPDETRTAIVVSWRELPEPYRP